MKTCLKEEHKRPLTSVAQKRLCLSSLMNARYVKKTEVQMLFVLPVLSKNGYVIG